MPFGSDPTARVQQGMMAADPKYYMQTLAAQNQQMASTDNPLRNYGGIGPADEWSKQQTLGETLPIVAPIGAAMKGDWMGALTKMTPAGGLPQAMMKSELPIIAPMRHAMEGDWMGALTRATPLGGIPHAMMHNAKDVPGELPIVAPIKHAMQGDWMGALTRATPFGGLPHKALDIVGDIFGFGGGNEESEADKEKKRIKKFLDDERTLGEYQPAQKVMGAGPFGSDEFKGPSRKPLGHDEGGILGGRDFTPRRMNAAGMNNSQKAYLQMNNKGYDNPNQLSVPEKAAMSRVGPGGAPSPYPLNESNRGGSMADYRTPKMAGR